MFAVYDIDDVVARLRSHGARIVEIGNLGGRECAIPNAYLINRPVEVMGVWRGERI